MAKKDTTPDLFKNLPLSGAGKGKGSREGEIEQPQPEPDEFPLGEYESPPQVIEDNPEPPPPPSESTTPPPEESPPEFEIEPEPESEPEESEGGVPPFSAQMNQMDVLKSRAMLMGIKFSNNIGIEALRTKIQARLDGEEAKEAAATLLDSGAGTTGNIQPQVPVKSDRQTMYENEMRLVRLRITNLDPKKKDLPGEIFCVANRVLGAVKKFIPYGEVTDNGYHVPYIIYRQLKEREFLNVKTRKDRQGRTIVETSMSREFALEELPPLTPKELQQLAASQAAAAGMSN